MNIKILRLKIGRFMVDAKIVLIVFSFQYQNHQNFEISNQHEAASQ